MASDVKQSVEVRSTTGHDYTRAGARWSPQWTMLDESKFTRDQLKQIAEDPHIEVRVGGRRLGKDGKPEPTAEESELAIKVAHLSSAVDDLTNRNVAFATEIELLKLENAKLKESTASETPKTSDQATSAPPIDPPKGGKGK